MILDLLIRDNAIGAVQIAKQLGVAPRTIQRDLDKLTREGRIKRIGPNKGGYWTVLDNGD